MRSCRRGPLLEGNSQTSLVFYADMPLVTEASMRMLLDLHARNEPAAASSRCSPSIARTRAALAVSCAAPAGDVLAIVEEADCTPEQAQLTELNPGLYCYHADWLWETSTRSRSAAKASTISPTWWVLPSPTATGSCPPGRGSRRNAGHQYPRSPG